MAPKRPTPLEDPPSVSSSEDEGVASDDEVEEEEVLGEEAEEEEEEEEEEAVIEATEIPVVASHSTVQKPVIYRKPFVENESSESDDTDDSPMNPKTYKPVGVVKVKKEILKSATATPLASPVTPVVKREVEEKTVVVDGKKRKKSESELIESEDKKSVAASKKQGLWVFGLENELELMKGMADLFAKHGKDFMADRNVFYEYVKNELNGEFSKSQLLTKARNLKKKYKKNDEKVKNGEELMPQEQKMYELSKKIWGVSYGGSNVASKSNGQRKRVKKKKIVKVEKEEVHNSEMDDAESDDASLLQLVEMLRSEMVSGCGLIEEVVTRGLRLIGKTKRVEMVKQWDNLLRNESKLKLRRVELVHEQGQLALDALRASLH